HARHLLRLRSRGREERQGGGPLPRAGHAGSGLACSARRAALRTGPRRRARRDRRAGAHRQRPGGNDRSLRNIVAMIASDEVESVPPPPRQGLGTFFRSLLAYLDDEHLRDRVRERVSAETAALFDSPPRALA